MLSNPWHPLPPPSLGLGDGTVAQGPAAGLSDAGSRFALPLTGWVRITSAPRPPQPFRRAGWLVLQKVRWVSCPNESMDSGHMDHLLPGFWGVTGCRCLLGAQEEDRVSLGVGAARPSSQGASALTASALTLLDPETPPSLRQTETRPHSHFRPRCPLWAWPSPSLDLGSRIWLLPLVPLVPHSPA